MNRITARATKITAPTKRGAYSESPVMIPMTISQLEQRKPPRFTNTIISAEAKPTRSGAQIRPSSIIRPACMLAKLMPPIEKPTPKTGIEWAEALITSHTAPMTRKAEKLFAFSRL